MHGLKSAIMAIFQKGLGLPCPVSATLKNVLCADEYLERLAKLESAYSFMLKYSKITVCHKPQSVMKGKGKGKGQSNFHKGRTSLEDKTYQIKEHACLSRADTHPAPISPHSRNQL